MCRRRPHAIYISFGNVYKQQRGYLKKITKEKKEETECILYLYILPKTKIHWHYDDG